jgi:hypothetical protein
MARSYDLYLDAGSDFVMPLPPVTAINGTPVNLTGFTVQSYLRRSYASDFAVAFTATITNPTAGIITLSMAADDTVEIDTPYSGLTAANRWVYDVVITSGSNVITKVFDGMVTVNPAVTAKLNTNFISPYVPEDFGGI